MPTPFANDPAETPEQPSGATPDLWVTLVVASQDQRDRLRTQIIAVAPHARIDDAKSIFDALLRSSRGAYPDLLVLDRAADGAAAPALIRHLARIKQFTDVLVFGDHHESLPHESFDVWAWSEFDQAVQRWVDAPRRRGAARG